MLTRPFSGSLIRACNQFGARRSLSKVGPDGSALSESETEEGASPFSKKMNVVGKRMQDSIRMLDAGALYTQTNKRDPNLPAAPKQVRAKLGRSLETPLPKSERMSERLVGVNSAFAEEILDVLNEALGSSKVGRNLFRGTVDASDAVEITVCKVNSDVSHVYAEWSSRIIEGFAKELEREMGTDHAQRFMKRSEAYITARLARHEGKFRTYYARKIQSKRVPRIYFKPHNKKPEFSEEQRAELDRLVKESIDSEAILK